MLVRRVPLTMIAEPIPVPWVVNDADAVVPLAMPWWGRPRRCRSVGVVFATTERPSSAHELVNVDADPRLVDRHRG